MRLTEHFCLHVEDFLIFPLSFSVVYKIEAEHSRDDLSRIFCSDCLDMFWSMVTFDHQSMLCDLANSCSLISWKWVSASSFILLFWWYHLKVNNGQCCASKSHPKLLQGFAASKQKDSLRCSTDMVSISCETFWVLWNLNKSIFILLGFAVKWWWIVVECATLVSSFWLFWILEANKWEKKWKYLKKLWVILTVSSFRVNWELQSWLKNFIMGNI